MTPAGTALAEDLSRRFVTVSERVEVGADAIVVMRPRSAEDLISEADFERDERLPYWAELWPSAVVLARAVASERGDGRRLLELGCGVGLVATAAMRAGFDVVATDYYADALLFTRANAHRETGREPDTRLLDWRALPNDIGRFDRVLAADVLYERPYARLVAEAIAATLAPGGRATVADPGRVAAEEFLERCAAAGLSRLTTEVVRHRVASVVQTISLHHFALSPAG